MPRKVPFSGKQKKKQLQEKKQRKQDGPKYLADSSNEDEENDENTSAAVTTKSPEDTVASTSSNGGTLEDKTDTDVSSLADRLQVQKINIQPEKEKSSKLDANSFRLHFFKESDEAIARKKKDAKRRIKPIEETNLEYRLEDVYPSQANLDFPKRPAWSYSLSKERLDQQEHKYFQTYLESIINQPRFQDLSYFELNIETWRQLWRVLEISDILLIIADIRYPILHLPPSLIKYITEDLHKQCLIVLNKVDFVPASLAIAWKRYIETVYPDTTVVLFSSYPRLSFGSDKSASNFDPSQNLYKKPFQGKHVPIGPEALYQQCCDIVKDKVDLSSWKEHLGDKHEILSKGENVTSDDSPHLQPEPTHNPRDDTENPPGHSRFKDGIVSIGCIGYPNVGKSSVLNALVGRKVVSVSQTPGHTKHFQTIFLTPTVKLCDCPGLVFPSMVPKSLQVLSGIFPVAQVREPYSVIGYLAKRLNLPSLLHLTPPKPSPKKKGGRNSPKVYLWSALDICEAFAIRSGFFTSKAGRPDTFRAANKILRLAVEGQICLCFRPYNYSHNLEQLLCDEEVQELEKVFLNHSQQHQEEETEEEIDEEEEEEEEEEESDDRSEHNNDDDDDDDDDNDVDSEPKDLKDFAD